MELAQIAWVVKDIKTAEKFFHDFLGIENFQKTENFDAKDFEATYYGKPTEQVTHVYHGYSGGTFIEVIQPVSGQTIFHDFLEKNPEGGVQHIAYRVPVADFDKTVTNFTGKGYPIISSFNTPIAKIAMFDTYKELGVVTEIMGITKEGEVMLQKMKNGTK
jgi:methylmalonyl-CoA/ethylmalonyl-CoA epimerase